MPSGPPVCSRHALLPVSRWFWGAVQGSASDGTSDDRHQVQRRYQQVPSGLPATVPATATNQTLIVAGRLLRFWLLVCWTAAGVLAGWEGWPIPPEP